MKKTFDQFLTESSLSRMWQHVEDGRSFGIVTAYRGQEGTPEELKTNKANNKKLKAGIRAAGFGFVSISGHFPEKDEETGKDIDVSEEGFIVISNTTGKDDKLKTTLKALGKKFNQDSILYKDGDEDQAVLIGTNTSGDTGLGKEEKIGKWGKNKLSPYYTKMRGDRKFVFESLKQDRNYLTMAMLHSKYKAEISE